MTAPEIHTPAHLEHRIETADGRTLAVAEWSDPNGRTDNLVPAAHGDWLAAHIPNAIVSAGEESGHAGSDADAERVTAWLAGEVSDLSESA